MSREQREKMVSFQLRARGMKDERILDAFREVPREQFVPESYRDMAYRDGPVPIGRGQTISQPYVVALMTEALEVDEGDRVLEIGTGSGYQAAILAAMGVEVYSIERHDALTDKAKQALEKTGYDDVKVKCADGSGGWPEESPFDGILVTAAAPTVPNPLLEQLKVGGHLVIPVAESRGMQQLIRVTRKEDDTYDRENLGAVAFVPLIGEEGWDEGHGGGLWG